MTFAQARAAQARLWAGNGNFMRQSFAQASAPRPTSKLSTDGRGLKEVKDADYTVKNTDMQALEVVERFESGVGREDEVVAATVGQHALLDTTKLAEETWLGSEQEELDA